MNAKRIAYGLVSASTAMYLGLGIVGYGFYKESLQKPPELPVRTYLNKKAEVIDKYGRTGISIANEISKKKRPYTIAAIAKEESDYTLHAVGDGGKSVGMYQIQSHIWGEFEKSLTGQTDKVEEILEALIKESGYKEAIRRYNGRGNQARNYRDRVIKRVKEMERLEKAA